VFGPSAAAAQIEASKAFAKEVMTSAGVPAASSRTFGAYRDQDGARLRGPHDEPLVVKASGSRPERAPSSAPPGKRRAARGQRDAPRRCLRRRRTDRRHRDVHRGEELSIMAITNGRDLAILPPPRITSGCWS
jgi:phosphoribosylamine--glycine ligase